MEQNETREAEKLHRLIKKGPAKACIAALLTAALATGGMLAYFTGTDTVVNEFNVSAGLTDQIEVVEPSWDTTDADGDGIPDAAQDIVPLQTLPKDPAVHNKSDIDAWCFIEVKVPTAEVSVIGEDGTPSPAVSQDLFTYTVNEGWTVHGTPSVADGYTTYTYLCSTPIAPDGKTPALFNDVTLVNLVEAQGHQGADAITVIGHAIQTEGFSTPEAAWAAYTAQNTVSGA